MNRLRLITAALALIAAFAFASQSKGDQYAVSMQQEYQITDPTHPDFGLTGSRSQIEPRCPETGQVCAEETAGDDVIQWNGSTVKF